MTNSVADHTVDSTIPETMTAIRHHKNGGPEVLQLDTDVPVPQPGLKQLLVRVSVAGLNYVDIYFREGIYPTDLPNILGCEGSGVVVAVGADVDGAGAAAGAAGAVGAGGAAKVGDRVAFSEAAGAYAQYCLVDADRAVEVPSGMSDEEAAAILLQGTTAHALATGVYPLDEDSICVITAGAGGVGQILTRMAKHLGAKVISLVSSDEKEEIAKACGADAVLRYEEYTGEEVRRVAEKLRGSDEEVSASGQPLSGRAGVDVVYDGVGASTFAMSLECIRQRGLMCLFGAASGPVDPVDPQTLNSHGNIYLARPSVNVWTSLPGEYQRRAAEVLRWVSEGVLEVNVGATYELADAAQAHEDLQARRTTGSVVLRVE